jgi:hypothetical protein
VEGGSASSRLLGERSEYTLNILQTSLRRPLRKAIDHLPRGERSRIHLKHTTTSLLETTLQIPQASIGTGTSHLFFFKYLCELTTHTHTHTRGANVDWLRSTPFKNALRTTLNEYTILYSQHFSLSRPNTLVTTRPHIQNTLAISQNHSGIHLRSLTTTRNTHRGDRHSNHVTLKEERKAKAQPTFPVRAEPTTWNHSEPLGISFFCILFRMVHPEPHSECIYKIVFLTQNIHLRSLGRIQEPLRIHLRSLRTTQEYTCDLSEPLGIHLRSLRTTQEYTLAITQPRTEYTQPCTEPLGIHIVGSASFESRTLKEECKAHPPYKSPSHTVNTEPPGISFCILFRMDIYIYTLHKIVFSLRIQNTHLCDHSAAFRTTRTTLVISQNHSQYTS